MQMSIDEMQEAEGGVNQTRKTNRYQRISKGFFLIKSKGNNMTLHAILGNLYVK